MENKDDKAKGQIQIADDVIASIAGTAALEAEGISSLAGGTAFMSKLSKKSSQRGVAIAVEGREVCVDLNVNVLHGCKIQSAARQAQAKVKDAIENMTGLNVCCVNITVSGIEFEKNQEPEQAE